MSKERVTDLIKSQPARQRAYEEKVKRTAEEKEREEAEKVAAEYLKNNWLLFRSGAKEIFQAINEEFLGGKGNISQRDFAIRHAVSEEYCQGSRETGEYVSSHHSKVSLEWTTVRGNGLQKVKNKICVEAEGGNSVSVSSPTEPRDSRNYCIYLLGKIEGYEPTTAQWIAESLTRIQFKSLRSVTEEVIAKIFGQIMGTNQEDR